jgi:antitoxin (DNA-binding transcriptional repressor) of toxin-antitoxin stability system
MKTATLITGKVKFAAGKPRDYGNGERINVVISPSHGGEDIKIWGNPDDPIQWLKRGESVTIADDGKTYALISTQPTNGNGNAHPPAPSDPPAPATPIAISPDVAEWAGIYTELRAALPDAPESAWRSAASTIFIQRYKTAEAF